MFSSIPGFYSLGVDSTSQVRTIKNVLRHYPKSPRVQNHPCVRVIALNAQNPQIRGFPENVSHTQVKPLAAVEKNY